MQCKFILWIPLLLLFNQSLATGVFPEKWKISYVSPVFKSGDISQVNNYHPISITSIIPKVFEGIVYKKIFFYNSNLLFFADDAKLFRIIKTPLDTELLQHDIDSLSKWCDTHKLYLNVSKCKIITFSKNVLLFLINIH